MLKFYTNQKPKKNFENEKKNSKEGGITNILARGYANDRHQSKTITKNLPNYLLLLTMENKDY